ncbi:sugar MFS transporter [Sphingomonas aracearum]|uniref:Glucose/galactose MFS transporter n=1 Tax=Sphingomonas aracearum TaxID=2283317 RepID=A0A369VVM4_9SPHN|nr:sugar MFS transporter [Sphingomonas aracearum]RDE05695.1 glucose/galactose MFS transporter [Sphingomonas aracearum]
MSGGAPEGAAARPQTDAPALRLFVFSLFFLFGGITSLNDVLIPKLKDLFTLSYTQAMLIQFCFFTGYAVIGIPGAMLVNRTGYMRGAVIGLLTMMAGCLLFIPAARASFYPLFLFALFVLAAGIVVVQIVANPLISLLGRPETAHSRLTFAQAFNSVGTTIFPFVGSVLILAPLAPSGGGSARSFWNVTRVVDPACRGGQPAGSLVPTAAYRVAEAQTVAHAYAGLAVALALIAATVWMFRDRLTTERHRTGSLFSSLALLRRPRLSCGALSIFLYVGAEVAVGSMLVTYLQSDHTLCLTGESAGKQLLFYWGGAMIGRFAGSAVLRAISPGKVLAAVALGAAAAILVSMGTGGTFSANALLAVGLFNSIMFPTIFALASEGLGPRAADGSGIIMVAVFGGAVIPLIAGVLADTIGLVASLLLPAGCYLLIAAFGLYARRPAEPFATAWGASASART